MNNNKNKQKWCLEWGKLKNKPKKKGADYAQATS